MLLLTFSAMATQHSSYEPLCRFGHAAVVVGSEVHMWRGVGPKRNVQEVPSTVEVFDVTTELWEQNSIRGTPPPGLSNTAYTQLWGHHCTALVAMMSSTLATAFTSLICTLWSGRSWWSEILLVGHTECVAVYRMVSYGDNQLIVFAGRGDSNEVHIFNLDKGEPKFQWELGSNVCTF